MTRPFGERFAIRRLGDGGILVNLTTGDYLRLNRTAAVICEALDAADNRTDPRTDARTDPRADAVAAAVATLRISPQEAAQAVDAVEQGLVTPGPRREPVGPVRFGPDADGDGYLLSSNGIPRVWASGDGTRIRRVPADTSPEAALYEYVRAISPKLLFLQGALVVHGAGCVTPRGLRAFCGESGAGKTTTVRAFVAAGGAPFAEDLLVVATTSPFTVHAGGERAVHRWAHEMAAMLSREPGLTVPTDGLRAALAGEPTPVGEVWMVDAGRRSAGPTIAPRRLGSTEAAAALMGSLFLGADSPDGWRRFLTLAATVAGSVDVFDAPMPAGVERLQAAARAYQAAARAYNDSSTS